MNPQDMRYTLPDRIFVELDSAGNFRYTGSEDYAEKVSSSADFNIDKNMQLSGEMEVSLAGSANPWLQLLRDPVSGKSGFSEGFSSPDLKEQTILKSGLKESLIKYTVNKDKPFKKDSSIFFFSFPSVTGGN